MTGSNAVSNSDGEVVEITDYTPFGEIRTDETTTDFSEQRKYTGHELDRESGLTYANARYYDAKLGRWLSEDNIFLDLAGDIRKYDKELLTLLLDPQGLNSYTYVTNNPLRYIDITGNDRTTPAALWSGIKSGAEKTWNFVKTQSSKINDAAIKAGSNPTAQMAAGSLMVVGSVIQANPGGVEEGAVRVGATAPRVANQVAQARVLAVQRLQNLEGATSKAKAILDSFSKQTFDNKYNSIVYHVNQHGEGLSVYEYTQKSLQFFIDNASRAQVLIDRTGREALKIPGQNGGWYTTAGEIITHWFER